jgi:cobalamin biosynthesis Mg chelatase CobN
MQTNSAKQSQSAQTNYQPSVPISLYKELAEELQSAQNKVTSLQLQNEQLLKNNQTLIREFTKEFEAIVGSSQQLLKLLKTMGTEMQEQSFPKQQEPQQQEPRRQDFVPPPPTNVSKPIEPTAKSKPAVNAIGNSQPVAPRGPEGKPRTSNNGLEVENGDRRAQRVQESVAKSKQTNAPFPQPNKQAAAKNTTVAKSAMPLAPTPTAKIKSHQEEPSTLPNLESTSKEESMSGWWLALTIVLIVFTSFGAGYFLMRPFVNSK